MSERANERFRIERSVEEVQRSNDVPYRNALNEQRSRERAGPRWKPPALVTEVLLPAESFERQLRGLFYDNTRPRARRYAREIHSFWSSILSESARRTDQYFEKFDEIASTKRSRVRRRRLCLIPPSMKFDITRTSTSPLNFAPLTRRGSYSTLKPRINRCLAAMLRT